MSGRGASGIEEIGVAGGASGGLPGTHGLTFGRAASGIDEIGVDGGPSGGSPGSHGLTFGRAASGIDDGGTDESSSSWLLSPIPRRLTAYSTATPTTKPPIKPESGTAIAAPTTTPPTTPAAKPIAVAVRLFEVIKLKAPKIDTLENFDTVLMALKPESNFPSSAMEFEIFDTVPIMENTPDPSLLSSLMNDHSILAIFRDNALP